MMTETIWEWGSALERSLRVWETRHLRIFLIVHARYQKRLTRVCKIHGTIMAPTHFKAIVIWAGATAYWHMLEYSVAHFCSPFTLFRRLTAAPPPEKN